MQKEGEVQVGDLVEIDDDGRRGIVFAIVFMEFGLPYSVGFPDGDAEDFEAGSLTLVGT